MPRTVATIDLTEHRRGYHARVIFSSLDVVGIGEPTATIGGALDCARQLVLDRERVRLGCPEVP